MTWANNKPEITIEKAMEAYQQSGSMRGAAQLLGCHKNLIERRLKAAQRRLRIPPLAPAVPEGFQVSKLSTTLDAAGSATGQHVQSRPEGMEPEDIVPPGHLVKGVSTYLRDDGTVGGQWVKTKIDEERRYVAMCAAAEALAADIPRAMPTEVPKHTERAHLNLYTITDAHLGMYSWEPETGADWDLTIAENVIGGCFEHLIAGSPPADTGIVNQGGDFLHTDSFKALTPASGHLLDADSRYQKIAQVAVRVTRRMVNAALMRHARVIVNMLDANHDPVGGTWLRVLFAALYENEPRVTVNTSPSPYVAHQHGKTMLGFHHGHGAKKGSLPLLFASRFPEMWGSTAYRYCHTGHYHHVDEKEHPGMTVVQHPTLAAPDAYSARGGWDSQRVAQAIFYHEKHGQVGRNFVTPEMLAA
jgi:hypothetical protein